MLKEIRLRDLGVIAEAEVELSAGFSVLTGETGAGKTMVVTGLDLLLGGRADPGTIRSGAAGAAVEGVFRVPADGEVALRAREAGADLDPDDSAATVDGRTPAALELIVARTVGRRSRAYVGGRTVPVAVIGDLGSALVAVHGQADQVMLRSPAHQRQLLDAFAGAELAAAAISYRELYDRFSAIDTEVEALTTAARRRRQEADLLRAGLSEIEQAAPLPGEDHALRELTDRLEHAEDLTRAAGTAHAALAGDDADDGEAGAVVPLLATARRHLDQAAVLDRQVSDLAARCTELAYLAADLAGDVASYAASVEADPALLAGTHERRAVLGGLVRKYGDDIDGVLAWAGTASTRLLELDGDDDRIAELRAERQRLDARLEAAARDLTALRTAAADRLVAAVGVELAALSMPGAGLHVQVSPRARAAHGADDITFLLTPHPGADPRPLAKGASGGELSRVMLAIEVVAAGVSGPRTMVFDEVDAGVGGRAAIAIGRRLARLARTAQVIVVTHLPQVAAYADTHLVVIKGGDGQVTASGVTRVDGEARIRELARMLAGQDESSAAREHAAELIAQAEQERLTLAD